MKKIILSLLVCCVALSVSAQGKKEMLESITKIQTSVSETQANINALQSNQATVSAQLLTLTQALGALQAENAALKERLTKLESTVANLSVAPGEKPAGLAAIPATLQTASDSIQALYITFNACKTPEEASKYIANPERVKPLMLKYYDEVKNWEEDEFEWDNDFEPTLVRKNLWYVDGFYRTYIVKTPSGYKVDWEASEMYNPYTEGQLMNMPNKVVEFRGKVEQTSDYSNDYWVEYLLNDGQNILAVYGRKGSAATKQLSDYVKQKTKHAIIKIKWVPGDNGSFELVEFVREGCSKF